MGALEAAEQRRTDAEAKSKPSRDRESGQARPKLGVVRVGDDSERAADEDAVEPGELEPSEADEPRPVIQVAGQRASVSEREPGRRRYARHVRGGCQARL